MRLVRDCSARCLNAFVAVPTPSGLTWLILDSGAGGVSLIARDYAEAFGLDPAMKQQRLRVTRLHERIAHRGPSARVLVN